eukprot:6173017-Lingulodinium_polyedra.AAC.1
MSAPGCVGGSLSVAARGGCRYVDARFVLASWRPLPAGRAFLSARVFLRALKIGARAFSSGVVKLAG